MNGQQLIAFALVGLAALFLLRGAVQSLRNLTSSKGGCASGCGKCAFAQQDGVSARPVAKSRPDIIPLTDVRSLPKRSEN